MDEGWDARAARCRAGLAPLGPFLGAWAGAGAADGEALSGTLTLRAALGDSFVIQEERLFRADGSEAHAELVVYRWDDEAGALRAVQHFAPAWVEHAVVTAPAPGELRWDLGPLGPRVVLRLPAPDALRVEVWHPRGDALLSALEYTRA
jgi:hypothetical protein